MTEVNPNNSPFRYLHYFWWGVSYSSGEIMKISKLIKSFLAAFTLIVGVSLFAAVSWHKILIWGLPVILILLIGALFTKIGELVILSNSKEKSHQAKIEKLESSHQAKIESLEKSWEIKITALQEELKKAQAPQPLTKLQKFSEDNFEHTLFCGVFWNIEGKAFCSNYDCLTYLTHFTEQYENLELVYYYALCPKCHKKNIIRLDENDGCFYDVNEVRAFVVESLQERSNEYLHLHGELPHENKSVKEQ